MRKVEGTPRRRLFLGHIIWKERMIAMKKVRWGALALFLVLILTAGAALAANVFQFEDKSITLFEGEQSDTGLVREGVCAGEGTITYTSAGEKVATISADGTVTAGKKGRTTVFARLKIGSKTWKTTMSVTVQRAVTNVTLNTSEMNVYPADDPAVAELLSAPSEYPVLLVAAGKTVRLKTTCTPADASNRDVTYTSSDEGVLKISTNSMKGLQAGECELTVASVLNPEVTETFHVIVTQPVKKITLSGPKSVFSGDFIQLTAICEPATATVGNVVWSSRTPKTAIVDENGVVTGISKGNAVIVATAADGSGVVGSMTVSVTQRPTGITLNETVLNMVAGKSNQLRASVSPANANNKSVIWTSSDTSIATVNSQGKVTALRRGSCTVTAECAADPEVTASAEINVVQQVTAITFDTAKASLNVRTSLQLGWTVLPSDATNTEVTFTSSNNKIATVDQDGLVTGVSKGTVRITAKAADGSGVRGQINVQVIQPVQGVSIQYQLYHVQIEKSLNVKAIIQPSNANNIAVDWTSDQPYVASVSGRGKNVGTVQGLSNGMCTITGTTQDGGYTATATVWVNDFNRAIVVDDLYMINDQINICFRNRSDFSVQKVYFTVTCYGLDPLTGVEVPIVCNTDGVSTSFSGYYSGILNPEETTNDITDNITNATGFVFLDYAQPSQQITAVELTIYSWLDLAEYTRNIPEEDRPSMTYRRYVNPTERVTPVNESSNDDEEGVG